MSTLSRGKRGGQGGECGEGNEQRGVTERLNMEAFVFFSSALCREPSRIHPSDTGSVRDIISVYLHCVGLEQEMAGQAGHGVTAIMGYQYHLCV